MRILFLTYDLCDNEDVGEIRVVLETIMALSKYDLEMYVLANYCNVNSKLPSNVRVYKLPFGKRSINFPIPVVLKAFFCSLPLIFLKRIQIIHIISTNTPSPYSIFKIRPFVMSADKPWDYDNPKFAEDLLYDRRKKAEESGINTEKGFLARIWDKIAFSLFSLLKLNNSLPRNVNLYVCRSKFLLDQLKRDKYEAKLIYVPHGVNPERFYPKEIKRKLDELVFIFVGRVSRRKGTEYLIKAFNKLSDNYKNIKLIIIGKGAESTVSEFKKLARDSVQFIGEVPSREMNEYYNMGDVFVLPSLCEPSSLTTLEAMAAGKPIISTRGGVNDFFVEGEMGFWIEPGDVDELYRAMEKFVLNRDIIQPMGKKIREHVIKNFTWDIVAQKLISAYLSLVAKK
jgi:glycosyltransferase involved in cell wall biosynthesis